MSEDCDTIDAVNASPSRLEDWARSLYRVRYTTAGMEPPPDPPGGPSTTLDALRKPIETGAQGSEVPRGQQPPLRFGRDTAEGVGERDRVMLLQRWWG